MRFLRVIFSYLLQILIIIGNACKILPLIFFLFSSHLDFELVDRSERERERTDRSWIQVAFDYICQFRVNAILASNFFEFVTDFDSYWQCMQNFSIDFYFCSFTGGTIRERERVVGPIRNSGYVS